MKVWVICERGRPVTWGWSDDDLAVLKYTTSRELAEAAICDVYDPDQKRKLVVRKAILTLQNEDQ